MKFLVLQDNFECCSFKRFDSMVWETVGEARTSTRRTSFGFYSCRDAICSSPIAVEGWRSVSGGMGLVCHGAATQWLDQRMGRRRWVGGKTEPIVVCRATNFLAAAVLPCWPIVNARLANRLGRLLRACSSFFLFFYTPFIPPSTSPPFSLLRHHLSFSMCPPRLLCCKLVRVSS